jgi:hypothetical protein
MSLVLWILRIVVGLLAKYWWLALLILIVVWMLIGAKKK